MVVSKNAGLFLDQGQKVYIALGIATDASGCYDTPQILISDFINFRENQQ